MHRRDFICVSLLAISPRVTRRVLVRRTGLHPEPRAGITAAKIPAAADLTHKSAGKTFDQVRQIPHIADGIRCHCGCAESPDYYSLLSCYEGKAAMAQHCAICQGEGRLAYRLSREGKSLDEIRAAIDDEFGEG